MAQTYGIMKNGKYWHVNTVVDMIELGLEYDSLPKDHKKGERYENLVYNLEDSIEYLANVRGVEHPRKLLESHIWGLYDYCGMSSYDHWMYLHRKRPENIFESPKRDEKGNEVFEEDPNYPVSKCDVCKEQKIFDDLWHGEDK